MNRRFSGITMAIVMLLTLIPVLQAFAGPQKVTICHVNESKSGTITVSVNAVDGGHFESMADYEASGPDNRIGLHGGDYKGECVSIPTPTPTAPVPTEAPSTVTPEPTMAVPTQPPPPPTEAPSTVVPEPTAWVPTQPPPPPTEAPDMVLDEPATT